MGKYCAYPGCRTGRCAERSQRKRLGKRQASVFKVPKHMVHRWSEAVQQDLTTEQFICELHFADKSVVREDRVVRTDGVIEMVPRSKYLLVDDAVPIAVQNKENANDASLPGLSNAPSTGQIENNILDDTDRRDRRMTCSDGDGDDDGDDHDQIGFTTFGDHLLKTTSESSLASSFAYDDVRDVPFGYNSDAMDITSEEPVSDDVREEANDEGGVCSVESVIDRLKQALLPESWCWTMNPREESGIVFVQIDRHTFQSRMKLFLHNDLSVTIQAFDSEVTIECGRIMTSIEEIIQFLRHAENGIVCCGVGLESEKRAENCSGFVGAALYSKFVPTPRCTACKQRRKILQNRKNRRKTDVRARYARSKQTSEQRQRQCRRLKQKVYSLLTKCRSAKLLTSIAKQ
ncbi:uncharacterized protein [Venturia canescens]|uniref:uncharacterized protein n=1 Tax=Venturia canescens TaxID=32260 RepID=UPI001C9CCB0E|nr:uncharacterized protein LOC122405822 [Venturia canescens]XP_043266764.1 uncharacterized protein LOC122405822 [Venturia canescens]